MSKENEDIFLRLMEGVAPLKKNNKLLKKTPVNKTPLEKKTKKIVLQDLEASPTPNKKNNSSFVIQKTSINKKLKKGKVPINKKIDFHGMSLFDAESLFTSVVKDCYHNNMRCLLFITGKGVLKNTNENQSTKLYYGKIRNNFLSWVKKDELKRFILSVEQAGIENGADGAFFVYLRKQKNLNSN